LDLNFGGQEWVISSLLQGFLSVAPGREMKFQHAKISKSVVGLLSLLSSLITVGAFVWHFMSPLNEEVKSPPSPREAVQIDNHGDQSLSGSRATIRRSGVGWKGIDPKASSPDKMKSASFRLHQNEATKVPGCDAQIGVRFNRTYDTDYAIITVAPALGAGFSQTVMGPGPILRFRCLPRSDALLRVLSVDDQEQFLDIALSLQATHAEE
jgi:hypothetical protein